jgi:hypothetical protein
MNKILDLIKEHGINLKEENAVFQYNNGFIYVSMENGDLDVRIQFTDKVVKMDEDISL